MGRDWLSHIKLDWASIKGVALIGTKLEWLLDQYGEVFQLGLGTMTQIKAQLSLQPDTRPLFHRPHSVPFSIRDKVGKELDRLEELGVLRRLDFSEWAALIVPVPKRDESIRICGNYKVTINFYLHNYRPKPSDLFTCMTVGKCYTKLDLSACTNR